MSSNRIKKDIYATASIVSRIKSFITDTFLVTTPILYITIYLIMGSGEIFSQNRTQGWLIIFTTHFAVILSFWLIKGQTPGLKAYDLKLVHTQSKKKISLIQASIRYFSTLFSIISLAGMLYPMIRKDKKTLQDILSKTLVIQETSI